MGLEFGKWLMDVAKYMLTALLLASFFGDMNTPGMVAIAILIMMATQEINLAMISGALILICLFAVGLIIHEKSQQKKNAQWE